MMLSRTCGPGIRWAVILWAMLALPMGRAWAQNDIRFEDVTDRVGLAAPLEGWAIGHAGAWGDVDGDDRPELYIGAFADRPLYAGDDRPLPNMLFHNGADGFTLSPSQNVRLDRQRARTSMALFVDLTNSGRLDLVIGTHGRGPGSKLYENRGSNELRLVRDAGDWPHRLETRNITAIDLDTDGLLDLIFTDGHYTGDEQGIVALRNRGGYRFEDVTERYGFPTDHTRALGTAVGDVNDDGRLDLFVADANRLLVSQRDGSYRDVGDGVFAMRKKNTWPCAAAFADLTGDGRLDLVFGLHDRPGRLFVYVHRGLDEAGMPQFEDVSGAAGLAFDFPEAGATGLPLKVAQLALVDLDNDGRRDLLLGMVHEDEQGRLHPVVFRNQGVHDGVPRFHGPSPRSIVGYYAAAPVTDYDRDGRIDLFTATWFDGIPSALFRNTTTAGRYLVVRIRGEAAGFNRMGVGATVRLYTVGKAGDASHLIGRADIALANGYASGDEAMAHFGVGDTESCDVVVTWQGRQITRRNVTTNQYVTYTMGDDQSAAPVNQDEPG